MEVNLFKQAISDVITLSNTPIEFKDHTLSLLEDINNENECYQFIDQFNINNLPSNNYFLENNSFNTILENQEKDQSRAIKIYKSLQKLYSTTDPKKRKKIIKSIHTMQGINEDIYAINDDTVKNFIEVPNGFSKKFIELQAQINKTYVTFDIEKRKKLIKQLKKIKEKGEHIANFNIRNKQDLINHIQHNKHKNSWYYKIAKTSGKYGKYAIWIAGITGAVYGAYLIYKYIKEHYTGKCKNYKGEIKIACILKIKIEAAKQAIKKLEKDYDDCKYADNVDKCHTGIKSHLYKWRTRLHNYEQKLNNLSRKSKSLNTSTQTNNKFYRRKRK